MKTLVISRNALSFCAAVALLASCSGSQAPIGAQPPATGERVLYSFAGGSDGADPQAAPISLDGKLYGTTALGGNGGCAAVHGCGTVYQVSASGRERVLHVFRSGTDGEAPSASLIDVSGSLFGTTLYGGGSGCKSGHTSGCGTVFEVTPADEEIVLYRFRGGAQGALPDSNLTPFNGVLYGETGAGGTGKCYYADYPGCGTIFKMSPSGRASIVYTFEGDKDAGNPSGGLLLLKGNFYGTSSGGGSYACQFSYGCGTVFEISPSGRERILHVFTGNRKDGVLPESGLVVLDGALYGTTYSGGRYNCGLYYYLPCGTVFKVTLSGQEEVVHNFKGGMEDGAYPNGLIAVGGNLYGTTLSGGAYGGGTVFKLTPSGQETILYQFKGGNDASAPSSGLIEVGGTLYGTAGGGAHGDGTVYAVTGVLEAAP